MQNQLTMQAHDPIPAYQYELILIMLVAGVLFLIYLWFTERALIRNLRKAMRSYMRERDSALDKIACLEKQLKNLVGGNDEQRGPDKQ